MKDAIKKPEKEITMPESSEEMLFFAYVQGKKTGDMSTFKEMFDNLDKKEY